MKKRFAFFPIGIAIALNLSACLTARAQSSPVSTTADAKNLQQDRQFFDLRYTGKVFLPTIQEIDGRVGPGGQLSQENFIRPGYYLGDGWKIRTYLRFDTNWGFKGEPEKIEEPVEMRDPSLGIQKFYALSESMDSLWLRGRLSYLPAISRQSLRNRGTRFDAGAGTVNLVFQAGKNLGDSPWSIDGSYEVYQLLKSNPIPRGIDQSFELYSRVRYSWNEIWNAYISYNAYPVRRRDQSWTPWSKVHFLELGFVTRLGKDLYLNPSLETPWMLRESNILLWLDARFL